MTTPPPPCPTCRDYEAAIDRLRTLATEDGELAIYVSRERILAAIDGGADGGEAAGQ